MNICTIIVSLFFIGLIITVISYIGLKKGKK